MNAWDSLLARARARRARLCGDPPDYAPEPAPAHDLVIDSIEKLRDFIALMLPLSLGDALIQMFMNAIYTALQAERLALNTGTPRDRQLADDALTFAIRVAGRIVAPDGKDA